MEEGFTGFNPTIAEANIQQFATEAGNCCLHLESIFAGLFTELNKIWASPKAVEFNKYGPELSEIITTFNNQVNKIVNGAINAYNTAASANGYATHLYDNSIELYIPTNLDYVKLSESNDGNVGMNKEEVKNFVLPNFTSDTIDQLNRILDLPTSIALYDDENGQQRAYSTNIKAMAKNIAEKCSEINNNINNALATEIDAVTMGQQNATESLTNG